MNNLILDGIAGRSIGDNPLDINDFIPETFMLHLHLFTVDGIRIRHELMIEDGIIKQWIGWDKPNYGCGSRCGSKEEF